MSNFEQILSILTFASQVIVGFGVPILTYYIRKLEKNTNSMREQLVEAAKRLGVETGVAQEKDRVKKEKDDAGE